VSVEEGLHSGSDLGVVGQTRGFAHDELCSLSGGDSFEGVHEVGLIVASEPIEELVFWPR
jgi:hypothetical protein